MRITTNNPAGETYFASNVADIEIMQHTGIVSLIIQLENETIVSDQYVGDNIIIRHLSSAIMPYVKDQKITLTFTIRDENGVIAQGEFYIVPCKAVLNASPQEITEQKFWTLTGSKKTTYPDAKEYLKHDSPGDYKILCYYDDETEAEINIRQTSAALTEVSPERFAKQGCRLLEYTVFCMSSAKTYIVDYSRRFCKSVVFDNIFGTKDSAHFTFSETRTANEKKEWGARNERKEFIHHERTYELELESGSIPDSEIAHYESIAYARELMIDGIPYVTTDLEMPTGSDTSQMNVCMLKCEPEMNKNMLIVKKVNYDVYRGEYNQLFQ